MYDADVLKQFSSMPVFSLSDVNQIINNKNYAKVFVKRMAKKQKILKIKKNTYTLHDDPFLISTFLIRPSYISSASALSHHNLITQMPSEIFCATSKTSRRINFISPINFSHTNHFWGFKTENYDGFNISIAYPEKAIIDSFSILPISVFEEAFGSIDERRMIDYIKKIKKSSVAKRVGFLMEKNGFDIYSDVRDIINYKYIPLDPLIKNRGTKNTRWGIIDNIGL